MKLLCKIVLLFSFVYSPAQEGGDSKVKSAVVLLDEIDSLVEHRSFTDASSILESIDYDQVVSLPSDRQVQYHFFRGKIKRQERKLDSARLNYEQAIALVDEKTSAILQASLHKDLAVVSYYLGDYEMCVASYQKALPKYVELQDSTQIGNAYLFLGTVSNIQGNSPQALDFYLKAERIIEKQGNMNRLAMVLGNIGIVYRTQEDTKEALKYYKRSLAIAQEIGDSLAIIRNYREIANVIVDDEPEQALAYFKKCLPMQEAIGQQGIGPIYINMVVAFLEMRLYDSTLTYLRKARPFHEKYPYQMNWEYNHLYHGESYLGLGVIDSSRYYFNKALEGAKHSGDASILSGALSGLYKLEKTKGNYKTALYHFERYKTVYDSLQNDEVTKRLTRLQMQYSFDEEKKEMEAIQSRNELIYEQKLLRDRIGRFALILTSLLVCLISLAILRAYRIKRNSVQELTLKNQRIVELAEREKELLGESISLKERELASMAMAAHEKNNLLSDLEQKIGQMEEVIGEDHKSNLRHIKKTIANGYSLDNSWSSFQQRFEMVHPDFMQKFKAENPDLTIEDLKLGAYLKVGMSNKEIANIINITHGSVKVKVNRLKTKLNMGPEDDLRGFMLRYA